METSITFHLLYQPGISLQSVVIFLFQSLYRKVESFSVYRSGLWTNVKDKLWINNCKYLDILDGHLDDVMIYPGEAHLDLVVQVRPARPVGQGAVQQGRHPGKALGEDCVQGGAHSVYKLNLTEKKNL